jgi:hypothetical protein
VFDFVGPALTRDVLASVLVAQGVPEHSYQFYGAHTNDAFVLDHRPEGWIVFFTERGAESSPRVYREEADACADLLNRVLAADSTRNPRG